MHDYTFDMNVDCGMFVAIRAESYEIAKQIAYSVLLDHLNNDCGGLTANEDSSLRPECWVEQTKPDTTDWDFRDPEAIDADALPTTAEQA